MRKGYRGVVGGKMRRDYKSAIKALVNALYTGDHEDGCREALEALDADLAILMDEDEEAARLKANDEDLDDDDFEPVSLDEFE